MHFVIPWSDGIEGLVMCTVSSAPGHHNSQCTSPSLLSHLTME